jgi:UMF1 family MFS transporter
LTSVTRTSRAAIVAWCLYDWGYGAFNTVVSTFVIATYFVRAVAPDPATGTAQWAGAQAFAGLVIALLAAPLGAIADRSGRRRIMLAICTGLLVGFTAALWFVRPVPEDTYPALLLVAGATISFEIALVFYNAMLTDVASPRRLGRVSGIAWGMGYGGGLCCLLLCLFVLVAPDPAPFGLDRGQAENVRATALLAAAWMAAFGWPVIVFVPDPSVRLSWGSAIRQGWARLRHTLSDAARNAGLMRFLIARMLYADGLSTLFAFGAIYAAGQFGMDARRVLLLGIALNVTAGLGALAFAFVEDRLGAKATVLTSLCCVLVLGCLVLLVSSENVFWALSLGLGVFVGPAQAASRSLMARIASEAERNAHFGLYALSGRVTGFVGPAALGIVTAVTHSQRAGMAVVLLLVASGAALLAAFRVRPATP